MTSPLTLTLHTCLASRRRGFAIVIVLWAVAFLGVLLVTIQVSSWRQAAAGREALARSRAYWAARAGVETMVARIQAESRQTSPVSTVALLGTLANESDGTVSGGASWRIEHTVRAQIQPGLVDAHAKLNVNLLQFADLMLLPDMTEDAAYSIVDYIDADDTPNLQGAENETYTTQPIPYNARNSPIRSLGELDLVFGVQPVYVRGLDNDLNNLISPMEQASDGPASLTARSATSADSGWGEIITASSTTSAITPTGDDKIDLTVAQSSELSALLGVNSQQAELLLAFAQSGATDMTDYIAQTMPQIVARVRQTQQAAGRAVLPANTQVAELTRPQLSALYDSCTLGNPKAVKPGKLNINTADASVFEYLASLQTTLADEIIAFRDGAGGEVASIVDLLDIPGMSRAQLAALARLMDVRSNVFIATCKGRDDVSGIEVEIVVEIDRSTLPITFRSIQVK